MKHTIDRSEDCLHWTRSLANWREVVTFNRRCWKTLEKFLFVPLLLVSLAMSTWAVSHATARSSPQATLAAASIQPESTTDVFPQVPREMNYQGILEDAAGTPVDGTHDLTFHLYQYVFVFPHGSWTEVYSETQTVSLDHGLFNVTLGKKKPLSPDLFTGNTPLGGNLRMGISVDGGPELSHPMDLLTVPFAFRADSVNRYPAPQYDSKWRTIATRPDPIAEVFKFESLGGDTDDYVIDLTCRYNSQVYQCGHDQAHWFNLTNSQLEVYVAGGPNPDAIRVRIWGIR